MTPVARFAALGALVAATAWGAGCPAALGAQDSRGGPGKLVIVGGGLARDNEAVYGAVVRARRGDGPLCVVPTAGGDPAASMASAVATLGRHAADHPVVGLDLSLGDPARAHDAGAAAEIAACSGFYFTGGVQSRVLDFFLPGGDTTVAYRALWKRWREGAVVAGSSAGAAMMSRVMIAGGTSAGAVARGVSQGGDEGEDGPGGVTIRPGMGFYRDAMLDQHFLARGRIGRLVVAVLSADSVPVGFGIDENTALVVDGDGASATVVGASGVVVVDARGARRLAPGRGERVRVFLAGAGDVVDLRTLEVRHGPGKVPLSVGREPSDAPEDPFARWAFLHLLLGMADGPEVVATFPLDGASLVVRRGPGFSARMSGAEGGVQGVPSGLSAGPFLLDLLPPPGG